MSTEKGAEKRQLSKNSNENEGSSKIEHDEDIDTYDSSNDPKKKKHTSESEQKEVGETMTSPEGDESTGGTPVRIDNNVIPGDGSRQIIAVSANKNPTAFFQLARKFLMTNEMCDLSALEGAIVSAVDAAHLLERSKLASIVRIHTSYVNVEPKRRRQLSQQKGDVSSGVVTAGGPSTSSTDDTSHPTVRPSSLSSTIESGAEKEDPARAVTSSSITDPKQRTTTVATQHRGHESSIVSTSINSASAAPTSGSRELRRARILVTVKRTENYTRWLEENPSQRQAIIAGTANVSAEDIVKGSSSPKDSDSANVSTDMEEKVPSTLSKTKG